MFRVIRQVNPIEHSEDTKHIDERSYRTRKADELIATENGEIIGAWECDTGHKNGHEIHVVYSNGIVKIYNERTKKYVTVLIARIPQVIRYGAMCDNRMKNMIRRHVALGYNEI